jgi:hypothetical protein
MGSKQDADEDKDEQGKHTPQTQKHTIHKHITHMHIVMERAPEIKVHIGSARSAGGEGKGKGGSARSAEAVPLDIKILAEAQQSKQRFGRFGQFLPAPSAASSCGAYSAAIEWGNEKHKKKRQKKCEGRSLALDVTCSTSDLGTSDRWSFKFYSVYQIF